MESEGLRGRWFNVSKVRRRDERMRMSFKYVGSKLMNESLGILGIPDARCSFTQG